MSTLTNNTTRQIVLEEDVKVCAELTARIKPGHILELSDRQPVKGEWVYCITEFMQWVQIYDGGYIDAKIFVIKMGIREVKQ